MNGGIIHLAAEIDDGHVVGCRGLIANRNAAQITARERPVVLPQAELVRTLENAGVPIGGVENRIGGGKRDLDFQAIPGAEAAFEAGLADKTEAARGGVIVDDVIAGVEPILP